jgi:hypothetical protein
MKRAADIQPAATSRTHMRPADVDEHFQPQDDWELVNLALKSWVWRIFSGKLYKIMTKDDEEQEAAVIPFQPNLPQRDFLNALHYRNIILKARQMGFTTVIAIVWLDHALFVAAHNLEDAEKIFADKIRFAYDNLPDIVRDLFPLKSATTKQLTFAHNNSAIRVATSMRSGTIHRLHISEMGKIAVKYPEKAREIISGSFPAVPNTGIAIMESTAEGKSGAFYDYAIRAEKRSYIPKPMANKEWAFHFYAWYEMQEYSADPDQYEVTPEEHEYFDRIEIEANTKITPAQRAWYVMTRDEEQNGDAELMWQEYPSTPQECWQQSHEGTYYGPQIAKLRSRGQITDIPHVTGVHVHTFWDIGAGDGTAIWCMQYVGGWRRFINFFEDWSKGYEHFVQLLRQTGYLFGTHYLPHDGSHERQGKAIVEAPQDILQDMAPDWNFTIVPRVTDLQHGINATRRMLGSCKFDQTNCAAGIDHIERYHKKLSRTTGMWIDTPEKHDGHSEAADALRQCAQGFDPDTAHQHPSRAFKRTAADRGGLVV